MDRRLAPFEARFDQLEGKFSQFEAKLETGLDRLRGEMVSFKAELIKWMFLFWLGTVATTLAIARALR